MNYVPSAGTWGANDPWVVATADPFTCEMARHRLYPLRHPDGQPIFNWPAKLAGLPWQGIAHWLHWADELAHALSIIPYVDRNLIGHSHGGNLGIIAAANGLKIRTLTTIATPRRHDVPAEAAVQNIGYWQHVFDPDKDWTATLRPLKLGQLGDGAWSTERRFLIPGVQNVGIPKVSHSKLFTDPTMVHWLVDAGIIDGILNGPRVNGDSSHAPDPEHS